jgi:hypothetical protein
MAVGMNNGGAKEAIGVRGIQTEQTRNYNPSSGVCAGVFSMFLVMSNELNTPKILYCPSEYDQTRSQATTFLGTQTGTLPGGTTFFTRDHNVSYFIGVDADDTYPQMMLSGDHNMGWLNNGIEPTAGSIFGDGLPYSVGLGTNAAQAGKSMQPNTWAAWGDNQHIKQGNVLMTDCSVQTYNRAGLQTSLQATGDVQHNDVTGTMPAGSNRLQFPQ